MDGFLRLKVDIEDDKTDAQLNELKAKLKDTQDEIDLLKKGLATAEFGDFDKKGAERQLTSLNAKAEKLTNQINKLESAKVDKLSESLKRVDKNTESVIKKVMKWGLALFSISSVYSILTKATSAYLSFNEETSKKIQSAWIGLGAMFEPLLNWIADKLLYLVAVVNQFVKALTGIDYVARANALALKKQAEAQAELNKQTASFDEMNIQQVQSTSNVSGSGSSSIDLPQLSDETINKINNIASKVKDIWKSLEPIRDILGKIIDFAIQHPEVIMTILGGAKLVSFIASIIGVGGGSVGLYGIITVLTIIAGISIKNIIDQANELNEKLGNNITTLNGVADGWDELSEKIRNGEGDIEKASEGIVVLSKNVGASTEAIAEQVSEIQDADYWVGVLTGSYNKKKEELKSSIDVMNSEKGAMDELYETGKLSEKQIADYIEYLKNYKGSLERVNSSLESSTISTNENRDTIERNKEEIIRVSQQLQNLGVKTDESTNKMHALAGSIAGLQSKNITLNVDANTSQASSKLNSLFSAIGSVGLNLVPKAAAATGAIINRPTTVLTGEGGKEGIVPLTDVSAMQELGQIIGGFVQGGNGNSVNNIYLGNRLVQREMSKRQEEIDFLTNGGV